MQVQDTTPNETVDSITTEFMNSVPKEDTSVKLYDMAGNAIVSIEEDPVLHQEAEERAKVARALEEAACTADDPRREVDQSFNTLIEDENDELEAAIADKDDGKGISDDDAMDALAEEGGLVSLMGVPEIEDILEELEDTGAAETVGSKHDRVVSIVGAILITRELRGIRRALEKLVESV
jgi:hypothetical protein